MSKRYSRCSFKSAEMLKGALYYTALIVLGFCGCNETQDVEMSVAKQHGGQIDLRVENNTAKTIHTFLISNRWGSRQFRFEYLALGSLTTGTVERRTTLFFTRNIPAFHRIPPGGSVTYSIDLHDGTWNRESVDQFLKGAAFFRVVYELEKRMEFAARQNGVYKSRMQTQWERARGRESE